MNAVGHTLQTAILEVLMKDKTVLQRLANQQALAGNPGAELAGALGYVHSHKEPRAHRAPMGGHRHFNGGMTWRGSAPR